MFIFRSIFGVLFYLHYVFLLAIFEYVSVFICLNYSLIFACLIVYPNFYCFRLCRFLADFCLLSIVVYLFLGMVKDLLGWLVKFGLRYLAVLLTFPLLVRLLDVRFTWTDCLYFILYWIFCNNKSLYLNSYFGSWCVALFLFAEFLGWPTGRVPYLFWRDISWRLVNFLQLLSTAVYRRLTRINRSRKLYLSPYCSNFRFWNCFLKMRAASFIKRVMKKDIFVR